MHFIFKSIFIASLVLLSACAKKNDSENILLVGNGADPATLDPSLITGLGEVKIVSGLFEGLVELDRQSLNVMPAVAKSWEISDDGKVYTFYLDKNAKWSDGKDVEAADFVYAWQRNINPKLGASYANMLYPIKNAKDINLGKIDNLDELGVKAIDKHTLSVELEEASAYFINILYHCIYMPLPRHILEKHKAFENRNTKWTRPSNIASNGAFTLTYWSINDKVSIRKNPNYKDIKNVNLDGVDFFAINDVNTEERAFEAKQLHITSSVSPVSIKNLKKAEDSPLNIEPWIATFYFVFNCKKAPFDDPNVRKAFAMAINRKHIINNFLKAGQSPAFSLVPEDMPNYYLDDELKIKENLSLAKELLKNSSWEKGTSVKLTYNTSELYKPIVEAIQSMLKENLDVDIQLYNVSWPAYLQDRSDSNFEIIRSSWIGDFPIPENFLELFQTNNNLNVSGFSDDVYDDILNKAKKIQDLDKRMAYLAKAEAQLLKNTPIIPIYFLSRVYLRSPDVQNWKNNILDYQNFKYIYLEK